jgi:hypothetical protein
MLPWRSPLFGFTQPWLVLQGHNHNRG